MRLRELKKHLLDRAKSLELKNLEVALIIERATNLSKEEQILKAEDEIDEKSTELAISLLKRRLMGEPSAYILNEKEFWGLSFYVDENVLIPRPDTETLVETALLKAKELKNPKILDLCTGSGAIATALSYEMKTQVSFSDISEKAIEIARKNYIKNTGFEPISRIGDLFEPWKDKIFDLIVSNPPYLTEEWIEIASPEVKKEPREALLGGEGDGLGIIRRIIKEAPSHLKENGYLLLEADYRQIGLCVRLFEKEGFRDIGIKKDLAGLERVVYGRRS